MSKKRLFFLSVLTGVLLTAGFYPFGSGLVMLFAFIPLLIVEEYICQQKESFKPKVLFSYALVSFSVFNLLGMWWVYNASPAAPLLVVIVGAPLMSAAFTGAHMVKRILGEGFGYFALLVFWLSFEYFFINAEISNPWFTLGYGFQYNIKLIQWYEFTGALGGTTWILLTNMLLFVSYKAFLKGRARIVVIKNLMITTFIIVVPIIISMVIYYTYTENGKKYNIVIVQPNVDPYLKFNDIPSLEQTQRIIAQAEEKINDSIDYVVAPETCINNNIWLNRMKHVSDIRAVRDFIDKHPQAKFVLGITSYRLYNHAEGSPTCRPLGSSGKFFDSFNSAIQIDTTDIIQVYHKSKLVTGVEKMPYTRYLGFIKKLTLQLGGTMRSHGTQASRENFISPGDSLSIAPVICWESVFGEFVTDYIKKGAQMIFIITNDGWWGNTPGHVQHNALAAIRAVETRRSIARSANTGISSFINQRGDMLQVLTWWKAGALTGSLHANKSLTFYVKHGDYLARIANFFSLIVVLFYITESLRQRKKKTRINLLGNKVEVESRE